MTGWRAAPAVLLLALAACARPSPDSGSPDEAARRTFTRESPQSRLLLGVSPASPRAGEAVSLTLTLEARQALALPFPTSQRYDFEASGEGVAGWKWSDGKSFAQVLGEEQLRPGQRVTYRARWTPRAPATYRLLGKLTTTGEGLSVEGSIPVAP